MYRWLVGGVVVLLLASSTPGQDEQDKKRGKASAAALEFKKLEDEAGKAFAALGKSYAEAKTAEAKEAVLAKARVEVTALHKRFLGLARAHPGDPISVEALLWVMTHRVDPKTGAEAEQAMEILAKDHFQDARISEICRLAANTESPVAEKLLRAVAERNSQREARGSATLALAQFLKNRSDQEATKKQKARAEADLKEAEKYYQLVLDKYADVKSDGERAADTAKQELYEIQHLSVGKTAPEIEGEDGASKKFKLSDYRGKVVVLDFWARW
jgi:hypothetical protein